MNRTGWLLRLEVPSNPEILCVVRSAVMRLAEEMGFAAEQCRGLTRAVDEALANIIRHAYDGRPGQPIELLCRHLQDRTDKKQRAGLEILIVDHGAAADRTKLCGRSLDEELVLGQALAVHISNRDGGGFRTNAGQLEAGSVGDQGVGQLSSENVLRKTP